VLGMGHFSFASVELQSTVAHDGRGPIAAARVIERTEDCGLAFLDFAEVPPGATIGRHRHGPSDEEIYVVVSGRGRYWAGGQEVDVAAGSVVVDRPGGAHGLANDGAEPLRIVVVDIAVAGRALPDSERPNG
jgi:quercetin dioxygenase-like cupin family protein